MDGRDYLPILQCQQLVQHILTAEWQRSNYTNRVTLAESHPLDL